MNSAFSIKTFALPCNISPYDAKTIIKAVDTFMFNESVSRTLNNFGWSRTSCDIFEPVCAINASYDIQDLYIMRFGTGVVQRMLCRTQLWHVCSSFSDVVMSRINWSKMNELYI